MKPPKQGGLSEPVPAYADAPAYSFGVMAVPLIWLQVFRSACHPDAAGNLLDTSTRISRTLISVRPP